MTDHAQSVAEKAAADVIFERRRQVVGEGRTPEYDDSYTNGSLAKAAAAYALHGAGYSMGRLWPWDPAWWKPRSHRENLVRAGALILAEIERLDRAAAAAAAAPAGKRGTND